MWFYDREIYDDFFILDLSDNVPQRVIVFHFDVLGYYFALFGYWSRKM